MVDSSGRLGYASHDRIKHLIGGNPYETVEKDLIAKYDSRSVIPQLVFLGLDESDTDGLVFRSHAGVPYFALDVTPKSWYADAAHELITMFEKSGMDFGKSRFRLHLPAREGRAMRGTMLR